MCLKRSENKISATRPDTRVLYTKPKKVGLEILIFIDTSFKKNHYDNLQNCIANSRDRRHFLALPWFKLYPF